MFVLKPTVCAVRERDVIVFLDLRRDRYFAAPLSTAPAIAGVTGAGDGSAAPRLLELGLGRMVVAPDAPLNDELALAPGARLSSGDLFDLWRACLAASVWLAAKRLDWMFAHLRRAKARVEKGMSITAQTTDLAGDVGRFERFRPWFPRRRVCLFDALALHLFLLARGHACDLVFAVRTGPFAAHAWVESDGVVCSDVLETCLSYTPIARV